MPRKKPSPSSPKHPAHKAKANPVLPFSLMLTSDEMAILRKEAASEDLGGTCGSKRDRRSVVPHSTALCAAGGEPGGGVLSGLAPNASSRSQGHTCTTRSDSATGPLGGGEEVAAFDPTHWLPADQLTQVTARLKASSPTLA